MLAVIKTGGKQYIVSPGSKIKIEKIDVKPASAKPARPAGGATAGKEDSEVTFDEVLLLAMPAGRQEKNKKLEIGTPFIKGAKVVGKVLKQGKGDKVIIFKYKSKKRYHVKRGHRQLFTEVEIKEISNS